MGWQGFGREIAPKNELLLPINLNLLKKSKKRILNI